MSPEPSDPKDPDASKSRQGPRRERRDAGTVLPQHTLPPGTEPLRDLALDLRWSWSHRAEHLWQTLEPENFERSPNPWALLHGIPRDRLATLAADPDWSSEIGKLDKDRRRYLEEPAWFQKKHGASGLGPIAYFCMEFGLGPGLPIYAGGLGILAGDYLKSASDLGLPVVGVGLLYQEGYFRQMLDPDGQQLEFYPFNDPMSLPVRPVLASGGRWLYVTLDFPGRTLYLRLWQAQVGRVTLYLLDSNDPLNGPVDRGITGKLYGGSHDHRLMQEFVLGIGGWRALEAVGIEPDICHLNEGHAALVVLERARVFKKKHKVSFWEAFWATRAGNVFTTHTAVAAGFDKFGVEMVRTYRSYLDGYAATLGVDTNEMLGLGRRNPWDESEPFNMAYLAIRGSLVTNSVSKLHGTVSRALFRDLYPRRPDAEVPVAYVTNGVHVPTWDSPHAHKLWEKHGGGAEWRGDADGGTRSLDGVPDETLWAMRGASRRDLVEFVRNRLARQLGYRGHGRREIMATAGRLFDPNVLTLGFARRFTEYKRLTLLLRDPDRLVRLLTDAAHPVQLVIAGKAHAADGQGKSMVQAWAKFVRRPEVRERVVFLEDYDMPLAQEMVRGVDVWLNTPRRPWEASGTSGMKVLANGGINCSSLDGWWVEAFAPDVGWAIGDGLEHEPEFDEREALQLVEILERQIVPEFYDRDESGIPRAWVARIRRSMERLTPQFSADRMVREYVEQLYLPAVEQVHRRAADGGKLARALVDWEQRLARGWHTIHFGKVTTRETDAGLEFTTQVYLGDVPGQEVRVELFADAVPRGEGHFCGEMRQVGKIAGAWNAGHYRLVVPSPASKGARPAEAYTARVVPFHPDARVPTETGLIVWQK